MICHNRMLLCSLLGVACTTPDASKSQPTAYGFAQLKQGTCLIRLKWIFAIRFATCRITRNLPASGPLLMICHNRMLLCSLSGVACTTPDTSKSQPTVYCFAQLKQGTCLIRLKHCLDDFCPEEIRTGRKADTGPFGERGCPLCSF